MVRSCCSCVFGFWNRSIACGDWVSDCSWAGPPEHRSGFSAGKACRPSPNYHFSAFVHFSSVFPFVCTVRRTVKTTYITLSHGDTPGLSGLFISRLVRLEDSLPLQTMNKGSHGVRAELSLFLGGPIRWSDAAGCSLVQTGAVICDFLLRVSLCGVRLHANTL